MLVIPGHVGVHERPGLLDRVEDAGVVGAVFHGAELGLGERVVVGDPGTVMGSGHPVLFEEVFEDVGAHRRPGVGMNTVRDTVAGERVLEHLGSEDVDLAVLDPVADEFAGVDIDDRVGLERHAPPGAGQVGDVPRPHLPGAGRFQHRRHSRRLALAAGRDHRPGGLIRDPGGDPPPGPAGGEHHPVIPGGREGVIHRHALLPPGGH
ncbi:hypothetical protein SAMN04488576_1562 [Bacillus sp. cl25]|nr:hypothetical protein SAMN04488576_1562 [Bacillus sp. cl25]